MANGDDVAPIIIKKVKKGGHGGHHGGAWKVAYADFVTAMMAFFLLLWLLNATTDEQKHGIADYFSPASISKSTSGSGGVLGGTSLSSEGAMTSTRSAVGVTVALPADDGEEIEEPKDGEAELLAGMSEEELEEYLAEREEAQFADTEQTLRQAIQALPELQELAQHLEVDRTPEGLRIQIVDQAGRSMFPSGGAAMFEHTRKLLRQVAEAVARMPQQIAVKGHTDASPFVNDTGYSNWELSTDRANASRRALIAAGLPEARISSVTGRAAQEPLVPEDPFSPRNRRISIILLRAAPVPPGAAKKMKAAELAN